MAELIVACFQCFFFSCIFFHWPIDFRLIFLFVCMNRSSISKKKRNKRALVELLEVASSQLVCCFLSLRKFDVFSSFVYLYKLIFINDFIYL